MSLTDHATWTEILQQPQVWRDWGVALPVADLRAWVDGLGVEEVWFCGAGSSAFIGEVVVAALEGTGRFRAVATTDLVARPHAYLTARRPLMVSFGRSGNSAESNGVLDALDALCPDAPRLNITCNAASALALRLAAVQRVVVLPEATHDAGFAMTSSFTTMLLTALAIFDRQVADAPQRMADLADAMDKALPWFLSGGQAARVPDRAVFLGAGPLAAAAREAALKVLELSAGEVAALWDTPLGFRHGPKSFVVGATDIWLFGSGGHAGLYEADLLAELRAQFPQAGLAVYTPGFGGWGAALAVVMAQVLAVVWSDRTGLAVDDPFAGRGTLTRVVSGVTLHPVTP